ncbi:MAG: UDP-glucose 4-epimerase GalE [Candidatus Saccharibacteria bacterium]|nr:UDP-glucose 4-epimerase GalE [Candidatus Saccharibacteria bacterium]
MKILLTGGLGYISSHTAVELAQAGHEVVLVDDLSNTDESVVERLVKITGTPMRFFALDVNDRLELDKVFADTQPDAVIHFAAKKAVGESVAMPLEYYQNNLGGLITLCQVMRDHNVKRLVFSSSATVYGDPEKLPLTEDSSLSATNPYGQTKLMGEQILQDLAVSDPAWRITILRYFNPVGAHASGLIGENPKGKPNNLLPFVAQVAAGKLNKLSIFGNDYETPDGTGVRDYIHVVDLAKGHVSALNYQSSSPIEVFNLGTGKGYSVMEIVKAFETAAGKPIPYEIMPRRPGDIAACYADPTKAKKLLDWEATKSLEDMCVDAWRWQQNLS